MFFAKLSGKILTFTDYNKLKFSSLIVNVYQSGYCDYKTKLELTFFLPSFVF